MWRMFEVLPVVSHVVKEVDACGRAPVAPVALRVLFQQLSLVALRGDLRLLEVKSLPLEDAVVAPAKLPSVQRPEAFFFRV